MVQFYPKVSIIIPVFNGSNYLQEAINSALAQTYQNFEVIVVNDGSNDGGKTEAIAQSYGKKIRYFVKKNGGVATALNVGIQNMTGDYFSWLSHDDVYYPHKLEAQIRYLQHQNTHQMVLYSDYDIIDDKGMIIDEHLIPHYEPERFLYELIQTPFLHGCTLLIPKACFDTIGLFNEELKTTQDYELWVKMANEYEFIHLPQKLIQTRHHREQGTNQVKTLHIQEVEELNLWFLKNLSPEKIFSLYNIPAFEFYLRLADTYQQRQLIRSYHAAINEGVRIAKTAGISSYMRMNFLVTRKRLKRYIRRNLHFFRSFIFSRK